tara:strand:- start:1407 stop:1676 length:270 start_codon:yes stop_codon:yes gene_type:complete
MSTLMPDINETVSSSFFLSNPKVKLIPEQPWPPLILTLSEYSLGIPLVLSIFIISSTARLVILMGAIIGQKKLFIFEIINKNREYGFVY